MKSVKCFSNETKFDLNSMDQRILKNIALRVSDSPYCVVKNGIPRTDGVTIFLSFSEKSLSFEDLEGLAAHEGGHIRFKSIIDPSIPKEIYPENPQLAQLILNICEDARIEKLLSETFPGFWDELDSLNERLLLQKIDGLALFPKEKINEFAALDLLIQLITFEASSHPELIFHLKLSENGKFKFFSKKIGEFWVQTINIFKFIRKNLTFLSTIIASKRIVQILIQYFNFNKEKYSDHKNKSTSNKDKLGKENPNDSLSKSKESSSDNESLNNERKNELKQKLDEFLSKKGTIKLKLKSSGIQSKNIEKSSRKIIESVRKELKSNNLLSDDEFREFIDENSEQLLQSKKEITKIISELKHHKKVNKFQVVIPPEIRNFDKNISIQTFKDQSSILNLNQVKNPSQIYEKINQKHYFLIEDLKKKFAPIKKTANFQRGQRRGYISGRDLSQVKISRGQFNAPFKSYNMDKGARLLILIDESGSMSGERIKIAKESCIILAESLKNTRISYGIIGFGAKSNQKIICEKIYKELNENVNSSKIGAIGVASSFIQNRDGSSFRSILKNHFQSQQIGNSTPILLIISDGRPHHGGTSYIGSSAIEDTRQAIFEIQQMGVKLYTISIDPRANSYLSKIYNPNQFVALKTLNDLSEKLINLVSQIASALSH